MQQTTLVQAQAALGSFYGDSSGGSFEISVLTPAGLLPLPTALRQGSFAAQDVRVVVGDSGESRVGWDARPEVRSARARLSAAGASVGAARSMLVRDVSAMVGLKQSTGTTTLLAGLSLPVPLFDQNGGEVARARAERETANYELMTAERQARAELAGSLATARLLYDRMTVLAGGSPGIADTTGATGPERNYLERADEGRRIVLGAYREGAVPLFQVLDAARAWGEARLSYYRTLYTQHDSVLLVLLALGQDLFAAIPPLIADGGRSTEPKGLR